MTLLNTLIASFNHDITRDLAWSVFAPPLLNSTAIPAFRPELTHSRIEWLKAFDKATTTKNPDYRLGRYYESLWKHFFEHDPQYEYIAHNIVIQRAGQTLGEMDFLVLDHQNGRFLHIEVAVKFYLFHPMSRQSLQTKTEPVSISDNSNWLGPNSKDNLDRKWRHLIHQQCQLSHQPEALLSLKKMGVDITRLDQALALKGYVFTPMNNHITPQGFNPGNTLHHYFTAAEFKNGDWHHSLLGIIPKQRWLTQAHQKEAIMTLDFSGLTDRTETANSPIMIAELEETNDMLIEKKRFFITPPSWP